MFTLVAAAKQPFVNGQTYGRRDGGKETFAQRYLPVRRTAQLRTERKRGGRRVPTNNKTPTRTARVTVTWKPTTQRSLFNRTRSRIVYLNNTCGITPAAAARWASICVWRRFGRVNRVTREHGQELWTSTAFNFYGRGRITEMLKARDKTSVRGAGPRGGGGDLALCAPPERQRSGRHSDANGIGGISQSVCGRLPPRNN